METMVNQLIKDATGVAEKPNIASSKRLLGNGLEKLKTSVYSDLYTYF